MPRSPSLAIATALFFFSGALGLGYELVWIRKAALVVGASQIAMSTVLTSFFLGIAFGSYFVGRYLRSTRFSPLFVYGVFEAAIGVFALAFPWLFELLELIYGAAYPLVAGSDTLLFALRFVLLFLLVLVPTFFMGGTLPLLLDALVAEDRSIGSRTSFLYGVNILGAVVGVLVTAYFAIPHLGMNGTSVAGGFGNLLIGAVALIAFRSHKPIHVEAKSTAPLGRFFPIVAFASGLLAIAYQICWARYFTLFHTSTIYFTAMLLAVYLLALAFGSFVLAPMLAVRWNPLRVLGYAQALVPLFTLYTLYWWIGADYFVSILGKPGPDGGLVFVETLEINHAHEDYFTFWSERADATFFAPLFQISLVIFLPVVLMGMGLPSLIGAAARTSAALRSVSGRVVFWNTVGSSLGGFLAGYVFLPLMGLHWTLFALGLGSLAVSAALIWRSCSDPATSPAGALSRQERKRAEKAASPVKARPGAAYMGLAAISLVGLVGFAAARRNVTWRTIESYGYGRQVNDAKLELIDVNEGPLTTTWVFESEDSIQVGAGHVSLAVTYKTTWSTQAIQGHVPVLFYPGRGTPKDCLGICLGSGQSFGALLMYDVEHLDVVDISDEMIELSLDYYAPYNHALGSDPRVEIHQDDGRHFVDRAAEHSYDVVSMEPPPPTADGVSSLYSIEFYESVKRILRPGGLFMQWLPLYRITPLDTKGIIKTQAEVFPETFVVKVGQDDFMVLSFAMRPTFDIAAITERCETFREEIRVAGGTWTDGYSNLNDDRKCRDQVASLNGVLSTLLVAPADISKMEAPVVYHDDNQLLSYSSGDRHLLRLYRGPVLSRISYPAVGSTRFRDMAEYFDPPLDGKLTRHLDSERARSLAFFQAPDPNRIDEKIAEISASPVALVRATKSLSIAILHGKTFDRDRMFEWIDRALEHDPKLNLDTWTKNVRDLVRNGLAVFADDTEEQVGRLQGKHGNVPIVAAMRAELESYREREKVKNAEYLFE